MKKLLSMLCLVVFLSEPSWAGSIKSESVEILPVKKCHTNDKDKKILIEFDNGEVYEYRPQTEGEDPCGEVLGKKQVLGVLKHTCDNPECDYIHQWYEPPAPENSKTE